MTKRSVKDRVQYHILDVHAGYTSYINVNAFSSLFVSHLLFVLTVYIPYEPHA